MYNWTWWFWLFSKK